MVPVYEIDPLEDPRWPEFLESHPLAGLFHSKEWLDALQRTYGFRASVLTTSGPQKRLTNGLIFCRVQSWLTGCRLISTPFSDHCVPLIEDEKERGCLVSCLLQEALRGSDKYMEIRSIADEKKTLGSLPCSATFCLHRLDLRPNLDELLRAFHVSCIRRKIARAQRAGVTYQDGTSEELLRKFYKLVVLTRRRQRIPPQPLSWFRNLIACIGASVKIRLASYEGQPVAAILTIRYKGSMTYKYGCSDSRFHRLGSMQLLIWEAIKEAKQIGLVEFDMGRTDWSNEGLLTFKDRWGSTRSTLTYLRYPVVAPPVRAGYSARIAKQALSWIPDRALAAAGTVLYRHFA